MGAQFANCGEVAATLSFMLDGVEEVTTAGTFAKFAELTGRCGGAVGAVGMEDTSAAGLCIERKAMFDRAGVA